jgi:hypothetical protein
MNLRDEVLLSGMEDITALPEIALTAMRVHDGPEDEALSLVKACLLDLYREGLIQVWCGLWWIEPSLVRPDEVEALLNEDDNYFFDLESDLRPRVYYDNVEAWKSD